LLIYAEKSAPRLRRHYATLRAIDVVAIVADAQRYALRAIIEDTARVLRYALRYADYCYVIITRAIVTVVYALLMLLLR